MNLPTYITGTTQAQAYRLLRHRVYETLVNYDLTPTYWAMIGVIVQAKDGIRQVEIAQKLQVKAPLITSMSRDLQEREIIQSVQNQFDARAKLLAVTPKGKKFVKTVEDDLHVMLEGLLEGLTVSDLETYHKVLVTIIENDAKVKK